MHASLETFLMAKQAAGLSPHSLRWYAGMINAWLLEHPSLDVSPSEIESYLAGLQRRRLAAATVAGHWRALKVWCAWLVECGAIAVSPMATIKRPKAPPQKVAYVLPSELRKLLAGIPGEQWLDARDRALALLLFYSGLRISEALGLAIDDVDIGGRMLFVRRGKGGASRISPFAAEVAPALLEYLYIRPPSGVPSGPPYLWLASDGDEGIRGVLTDNGVRQMLRRRCKAAGMRYLNPHSFRHGFAMWTLNAGMPLDAVAAAMGHSSTQVTQATYARWLPEAMQREYDEAMAQMRRGRTQDR